MRLFLAIQLNRQMKDALTGLQQQMQRQGVRGNFTRRENLHLTLAFIGEYPDPYDVKDILETIDFEPFEISLDGIGSFGRPSGERPLGSLLWAGLSGSEELKTLAKRLRRALAEAGIPYDRKKFSPHITLVRKPTIRSGAAADAKTGSEPATLPAELFDRLPSASMTVDHISLMRSDRGKHGMIYTEL